MNEHSHHQENSTGNNVSRWIFWAFILIAGFFLITEHRAHLFGILPYLLLLACPLMHLFHGHGGHGGHRNHNEAQTDHQSDRESTVSSIGSTPKTGRD